MAMRAAESTDLPQISPAAETLYPLTVYYDRGCPLCRAEFEALRRLDTGARLRLVDCSPGADPGPWPRQAGIRRDELLAALHLRTAAGDWLRAVDAFVQIYTAVGMDRVVMLLTDRRARPLADRLYRWLARHRRRLSRLGLARPFGWLLRRAVRRHLARRVSNTRTQLHPACRRKDLRTRADTSNRTDDGPFECQPKPTPQKRRRQALVSSLRRYTRRRHSG